MDNCVFLSRSLSLQYSRQFHCLPEVNLVSFISHPLLNVGNGWPVYGCSDSNCVHVSFSLHSVHLR